MSASGSPVLTDATTPANSRDNSPALTFEIRRSASRIPSPAERLSVRNSSRQLARQSFEPLPCGALEQLVATEHPSSEEQCDDHDLDGKCHGLCLCRHDRYSHSPDGPAEPPQELL